MVLELVTAFEWKSVWRQEQFECFSPTEISLRTCCFSPVFQVVKNKFYFWMVQQPLSGALSRRQGRKSLLQKFGSQKNLELVPAWIPHTGIRLLTLNRVKHCLTENSKLSLHHRSHSLNFHQVSKWCVPFIRTDWINVVYYQIDKLSFDSGNEWNSFHCWGHMVSGLVCFFIWVSILRSPTRCGFEKQELFPLISKGWMDMWPSDLGYSPA